MTEVVFRIVLAVVTALAIIISAYVVPFIKSKIDTERLGTYLVWAKQAVECAEMIFAGQVSSGAAKKQWCIDELTKLINSKKEVITADQLSILIEAAVKELKLAEESAQ